MAGPVVVIGYGNSLRGDDAIGPQAAAAVAGWERPGVTAIAVPQLTPELAEAVASARLVLFVDAGGERVGEGVRIREVAPSDRTTSIEHVSDSRSLLALTLAVFGICPRAWLITVPATDFAIGEGLSARAADGLDDALALIDLMIKHAMAHAVCAPTDCGGAGAARIRSSPQSEE
jgi:hydrogenase maturation protease